MVTLEYKAKKNLFRIRFCLEISYFFHNHPKTIILSTMKWLNENLIVEFDVMIIVRPITLGSCGCSSCQNSCRRIEVSCRVQRSAQILTKLLLEKGSYYRKVL
jgi:hypothetical protein